jgi:hypothetical protein
MPNCLLASETALNAASHAEAAFAYGSSGPPVLDEYLAYVPGQGQNAMTAVSQALSSCGQISMTESGVTLTGTVGSLSFPAVADQSTAYQLNLSASSVTLGIDLVVFRKADTVAMIWYADLGTPPSQALQSLVQSAAAKLS